MHIRLTMYRRYFAALFLLFCQAVIAEDYSNPQVNKLLQSRTAPDGVVFELLTRDKNTWEWAAPMIASLRRQLLNKFPGIDIAVVSHGGEQFELTKDRAQEQPAAIAVLNELKEGGVNLHVCGTHSSMRNVAEDAYIDIVDVSPYGPTQINDYVNLGYTHIRLRKPSG